MQPKALDPDSGAGAENVSLRARVYSWVFALPIEGFLLCISRVALCGSLGQDVQNRIGARSQVKGIQG